MSFILRRDVFRDDDSARVVENIDFRFVAKQVIPQVFDRLTNYLWFSPRELHRSPW